MSRQSMAPQRNLTLTEELEKLEQSITLTLQEIDHNFSRAHRIVTTSILPVVEKYAEHSKDVWESSKFWKQFFEASANVSLSGYEEPLEQEETITEDATATAPSTPAYPSPSQANDSDANTMIPKTNPQQQFQSTADDSILSTTPLEQSTPRPRSKHRYDQEPSMALYSSPYETLKREIKGDQQPPRDDSSTLPSTPRNRYQSQLDSSPFIPPSTSRPHRTPKDDPLLHRILDKNWRLQATPHTTTRAAKPSTSTLPYRGGRTPSKNRNNIDATPAEGKGKSESTTVDDNLDSSPAMPAPQLHSEIFGTPVRRTKIPGVSVLIPARGKRTPSQQRVAKTPGEDAGRRGIWESDSDDEDEGPGMSPPKTIQFHVPQSKLLRTPAREASKKIVEDLLLTAGGNVTDEFEESSPSVVKRGAMDEDDTF
ncbi:MAG: hypothetical protein LQ343_005164 [Gyalolechia ehrenbergii]|nr:MAG: hypothetical protein LQ343_005164 [Gyalolechia ehrenbergii]